MWACLEFLPQERSRAQRGRSWKSEGFFPEVPLVDRRKRKWKRTKNFKRWMQRTLAWGTSSKMILIQKLHVMGKTVAKIVWIKMLCSSICKMTVNEAEIHTCSPGILHFHLWPGWWQSPSPANLWSTVTKGYSNQNLPNSLVQEWDSVATSCLQDQQVSRLSRFWPSAETPTQTWSAHVHIDTHPTQPHHGAQHRQAHQWPSPALLSSSGRVGKDTGSTTWSLPSLLEEGATQARKKNISS